MGKFEEGYCFRVNFGMQEGLWTICSENPEMKDTWFGTIKDLAPNFIFDTKKKQSPFQSYLSSTNLTFLSKSLNLTSNVTSDPSSKPKSKESIWVTLNPWTACSLECGGGQSFLQRKCIPGSDPSLRCKGPSLLVKECNSHPCPTTLTINLPEANSSSTTFKYVRISNRPQRSERCHLKEGDMMLAQELETQGLIRFPIRVVLNNETLSLFSSGVKLLG